MASALDLAAKQLGLNERDQQAAIQDYLTTGGVNLDPATTAWCAAFVNSTLTQAGMKGTGSNLARSFMDWGQATEKPNEGDLAVFSRGDPNGPYGHVGFFKGYDDNGNILVLGGNQGASGEVSIASYSPDRLLGFRTADGLGGNALAGGQAIPGQNALASSQAPTQPGQNALAPRGFQPQQIVAAGLDPRAFMTQQNALAPVAQYTTQYRG